MTALTFCIDTVPQNIVEYLVGERFDVWLFDWRTSPLLEAHKRPYTLDEVARYDWPAAVREVKRRSGVRQVSVLAHCLSSPCFLLSLLRGHTAKDDISAFVASQVALHLVYTSLGMMKIRARIDKLLPKGGMIHQQPDQVNWKIPDLAVSLLSRMLPTTFECGNRACYRQNATFGELVYHPRINDETHAIMSALVPECNTDFLRNVASSSRQNTLYSIADSHHFERLKLPIHFISGSENRMYVPESTQRTFDLLCSVNGDSHYRRNEYEGFGHLDCYFGDQAPKTIWPDIAASLVGESQQPL